MVADEKFILLNILSLCLVAYKMILLVFYVPAIPSNRDAYVKNESFLTQETKSIRIRALIVSTVGRIILENLKDLGGTHLSGVHNTHSASF